MARFKAAVVQSSSIPFAAMATAEKAARLIAEAATQGASLSVFPEVFLGGYPKGASFGAPVGIRLPAGRDEYRRYHEGAVDLDGPEVAVIVEAARQAEQFVVMGVLERDGGTLYCTALFIDGASGVVGKHRKLMPTAAERLIWGFGDGSTMPVLETPIGRIGAVICWENYMPALRLSMYDKGVSLYCAPTADDRDTWAPTMQHIALEGRCFVFSACQYLTRTAFPADFECALGNAPETVLMRGGSLIVSPLGKILAGPDFTGETILYAEIDTDEVARGKYDFDVVGHYARPDIFRLHVDETARAPVTREG